MKKGLLSCQGTIDINQFWPQNIKSKLTVDSDADTVKVLIDTKKGFDFVSSSGKKFNGKILFSSGFFHYGTSKSTKDKLIFKPSIKQDGTVTIRVQGVDAPELHYSTGPVIYRQQMGETATVQLYEFLKTVASKNIVHCRILTRVNVPNDVFDMYGRMIADIVVVQNGKEVNVNHWLVENGLAFPAFYDSLEEDEINTYIGLYKNAGKKNIWAYYSAKIDKMDRSLTHSKTDPTYKEKADRKKPVIFPKLFRRLWTYEIQNNKVFSSAGYYAAIAAKKDDKAISTKDFLASLKTGKKAKLSQLASFLKKDSAYFNCLPHEIVIHEAGTVLKDPKGKKITDW